MYAVVAMALSRIVERTRQGGTAAYQPIIIGFPFSLRPFLDVGSHPQTDADAAIRITFGSITLPFDACARGSAARVRRVVWRGARLATEQFKERFDPAHRSSFLASAYLTNVDLFKRTLGRNSDPIQAPKSVINASSQWCALASLGTWLTRGEQWSAISIDSCPRPSPLQARARVKAKRQSRLN